jgi:hypothetical protein
MEQSQHTGKIQTKDQFVQVASMLTRKEASNADRELASEILSNLYKSPDAWKICKDVLIDHAKLESSVLFTAAKLLRVKTYFYFSELPESNYVEFFSFVVSRPE